MSKSEDHNAFNGPSEGNPSEDLIWGVDAISKAIGKTPRQTFHLVETRQIPAGKTGGRIVASRQRLRAHFDALTSGEVRR